MDYEVCQALRDTVKKLRQELLRLNSQLNRLKREKTRGKTPPMSACPECGVDMEKRKSCFLGWGKNCPGKRVGVAMKERREGEKADARSL